MPSESARPLPCPSDPGPEVSGSEVPGPAIGSASSDQVLRSAPVTDLRALRRALRRTLHRHSEEGDGSRPLSLFGFADKQLIRLPSSGSAAPEALLGLHVPEQFDAIAAVAASVMTTSARNHSDTILAVAVTRDDQELCFLAGEIEVIETWQPQGWLVDACRRSLGLPTRPTLAQPVDLSLALWLDYLLVALVEHRAISWDDAVECCPVTARVIDASPELLGERLAQTVPSWSALRIAAAGGAPLPVPVRAEHAAWMDDAMFARWVLGFFPDLDDLRSDIEFLASAEVAQCVERVVQAARHAG